MSKLTQIDEAAATVTKIIADSPMYAPIPERTLLALMLYRNHGDDPGGFLAACLENDFVEACTRADSANGALLPAIANFINNRMPMTSYGSPEVVRRWIKNNGLDEPK